MLRPLGALSWLLSAFSCIPGARFATHSCEASRGDWPTRRHECNRISSALPGNPILKQKHRTSDWMGHFSPHSLPCQRRSEADQTQRAFAGKSQDGSPQATGRRVLRVQEGGTVQGANAAQPQPQLTSFQPVSELPPAQPDSVFSPIVIAVSSPYVILPHQHKLHTYGLLRLKGNN